MFSHYTGSKRSRKSSVYQGIEYIYRKEIGEARLRDYGKREDTEAGKFKRYMSNWTCNDVNVKMWVNGSQKNLRMKYPYKRNKEYYPIASNMAFLSLNMK